MDEQFPLDWYEFRDQWHAWVREHLPKLHNTEYIFKGKNFMADDVLGVWEINGRNVEIATFTFPDLTKPGWSADRVRSVGVTFGDSDSGGVVHSFTELEELLGIDPGS
jgi:hypothetical protein